eukprot:1270192-Rhodomonas_salina.1
MFEKPQERLKAAEGGEATAAEGGSAAGADSAAAGSSHSTTDPQPIIIDDDGLRVGVAIEMPNHPLKGSRVAKTWRHRRAAMQTFSLDERKPSSEPELRFFQSPQLDLQL